MLFEAARLNCSACKKYIGVCKIPDLVYVQAIEVGDYVIFVIMICSERLTSLIRILEFTDLEELYTLYRKYLYLLRWSRLETKVTFTWAATVNVPFVRLINLLFLLGFMLILELLRLMLFQIFLHHA